MNTRPSDLIKVTRDIEVVQIPDGYKVRLHRNSEVRIMQSLGGTYTVMTQNGGMVRIDGQDADAIGIQVEEKKADDAPRNLTKEQLEEKIWYELRTVYDPEIPVNVVDLGLVYENAVTPLPEGGHKVYVKMTLTAPGCGMGPVLQNDAQTKIARLPTVKQATVEIVLEPTWTQDMMSESAKLQLGLI